MHLCVYIYLRNADEIYYDLKINIFDIYQFKVIVLVSTAPGSF